VDIETPEAGGVLFSQGSRFGGHALYIRDRRLHYVYNWVGEHVQVVEADEEIPTGRVVLSASFVRENDALPTLGTVSLHMRDAQVGEGKIMTQPGKFGLGGGGFVVGRSGAEPVTDYAGDAPWPFNGGTIKRVVVDVSGEAFEDLAREARAAFAHQ
jgi:arylsulfatase